MMTVVKELGCAFAYQVTDSSQSRTFLSKRGKTAIVAFAALAGVGVTLGVLSQLGATQSFLMQNHNIYYLATIGGVSITSFAIAHGSQPFSQQDFDRMQSSQSPKSQIGYMIGAATLTTALVLGFWMVSTPSGAKAVHAIGNHLNAVKFVAGGLGGGAAVYGFVHIIQDLNKRKSAYEDYLNGIEIENLIYRRVFNPEMIPNWEAIPTTEKKLEAAKHKIRERTGMLNPNTPFETVLEVATVAAIRKEAANRGWTIDPIVRNETVFEQWNAHLAREREAKLPPKQPPFKKELIESINDKVIRKQGEKFGWIKSGLKPKDAVAAVRFTAGVLGVSIEAIGYMQEKDIRSIQTKKDHDLADIEDLNLPDNYLFSVTSETLEKVLRKITYDNPNSVESDSETDDSDDETDESDLEI